MKNGQKTLIMILDILLVLSVFYAVFGMVFSKNDAVLVTSGLGAFKYYTVLSNMLCALTSLICVVYLLISKTESLPKALYILHLAGSSVVSVTLIVVLVYLGPSLGYGPMFSGVCFWLHLLAPVLAIISQILIKHEKSLKAVNTLWAVVPTIMYGIGYIAVNAANWTGKSNPMTDIYGFLKWGWGVGAVLLVAVCLLNWLMALLFWRLGRNTDN
jgi:hypothetical protein